jgi:hypothetical protein
VTIDVVIRPAGLHRFKMGIPAPGFRWTIVHGMGLCSICQKFWGPPFTGSPLIILGSCLAD